MQYLEGSGTPVLYIGRKVFNPLNSELNPICHLLAFLGAHHILHVGNIRVKQGRFRRIVFMSCWHLERLIIPGA
jgi:hypothetical protein